ncbi:MAG TPA: SDR family oxidoreductase [Afipia sp.]
MTSFNISNTVVVVTGASRGIGLAIARHFLAHGANVVIGGIDPTETEEAVARLESGAGTGKVTGLAGDISIPDAAQALVDIAYERFGRLDTLVGNAGIDVIKPAVSYLPDEWDRILDVNLRGAFLPAQMAARAWIERRQQGSVVLTSSIAAKAGIVGLAPYGASKGAIDQLVRNLAVEWAEHGIRVNAVAPGYVDNVMAGVVVHSDPTTEERIRTFTPLRRRATVDEIAAPFVFLASPAASYITGAVLAVDGGYTAQ